MTTRKTAPTRRELLRLAGLGAAAIIAGGARPQRARAKPQAARGAEKQAAARKPNILFILIDDMGWRDLGFMGSTFYDTPHIDRLASQGMVFTNAYANGANCAPTRACLMSGQYAPRHGVYTVSSSARGASRHRRLVPIENTTVLADKNVTVAEALKSAGYVTATMGKWHLGPDPTTQGFDVNVGGSQAGHPPTYFSPYRNRNLPDGAKGEYLTDRLTDEAIKFIEANKARPFFLYLPHYAVHTPIQAKKDITARYEGKTPSHGHRNAKYAAMIESVDTGVGRIMARLDELKLADETVVVFFSDNGGVKGITSMEPLRGGKGSYYEGGIREPMIVRWPGKVKARSTCDTPVIGVDFYPTLLEIASAPRPKGKVLDGVSIVPLLRGAGRLEPRALFWHFPVYLQGKMDGARDPLFRTRPGSAVRLGDWKLIEYFEDGGLELYNLKADVSEAKNLAQANPDKTAELHKILRDWRKAVNAPVPTQRNPEYNPDAPASTAGQKRKKR